MLSGAVLVLLTGAALLRLGGPLADAAAAACRQYNACGFTPRRSYDQGAILLYKDVHTYTTIAWPLQPAGTGILLLVAALSALAAFRLLRHRTGKAAG